jgi:enoyl-[acyl-carrier-protein] reductase (NADH)
MARVTKKATVHSITLKHINEKLDHIHKPDGTYEIVIHAIGFKSTQHAQDFMNDITNFEWQQENPTIH